MIKTYRLTLRKLSRVNDSYKQVTVPYSNLSTQAMFRLPSFICIYHLVLTSYFCSEDEPQHGQMSEHQHGQVGEPQHSQVSEPQHGQVSEPQHEQVGEPQHGQVENIKEDLLKQENTITKGDPGRGASRSLAPCPLPELWGS